jgi:hypothetical protein
LLYDALYKYYDYQNGNIYPAFGNDTARMLGYPDGNVDLDEVKNTFERRFTHH